MKLGITSLALVVALAASSPQRARAGECAKAGQHLIVARRAVAVGDFATAVREYQRSYEADGEPRTLVLLAQTYAKMGEWAAAIDVYNEYLDQDPSGARAVAVEREIGRLTELRLQDAIPVFDEEMPPFARDIPVLQ